MNRERLSNLTLVAGLCYDLRTDYLSEGYSLEETAEFDKEETIAGIETALQNFGLQTIRIGNYKQLMSKLLQGHRWDLVFNIAEGMYGEGRESLVPALLDAYKIPYTFSNPAVLAVTLNKAFAKHVIQNTGINTPKFIVFQPEDKIEIPHLDFPVFIKPIAEGTGKGIDEKSLINNPQDFITSVQYLLSKFNQPVICEEFLPGREFTIGIVGNGVDSKMVGAMEIIVKTKSGIYSNEVKENYEDIVEYNPVKGSLKTQCENFALAIWNAFGCYDGGRIDVKIDKKGNLSFIEINPLAGLNPIHSDLPILARLNGIEYQDLINMILTEFLKRKG